MIDISSWIEMCYVFDQGIQEKNQKEGILLHCLTL